MVRQAIGETVYIGFGGNMGDRLQQFRQALRLLNRAQGIQVVLVSPVYETEPVGFQAQTWFYNAIIKLACRQSPEELLETCLAIERTCGRARLTETQNGPRPCDLDILFYGSHLVESPHCRIPHPRMLDRLFVLKPFCDIDPEWIHPVSGRTMQAHLDDLLVATREDVDAPIVRGPVLLEALSL